MKRDEWLPSLSMIEDIIAEDLWSYELLDGTKRSSRLIIGKPAPIPNDQNGDWYCPVFVEHMTQGVRCVVGVGPIDALVNAMRVVDSYFTQLQPRPRAAAPAP